MVVVERVGVDFVPAEWRVVIDALDLLAESTPDYCEALAIVDLAEVISLRLEEVCGGA